MQTTGTQDANVHGLGCKFLPSTTMSGVGQVWGRPDTRLGPSRQVSLSVPAPGKSQFLCRQQPLSSQGPLSRPRSEFEGRGGVSWTPGLRPQT